MTTELGHGLLMLESESYVKILLDAISELREDNRKMREEIDTIRGCAFASHLVDYDPSDPGCSD